MSNKYDVTIIFDNIFKLNYWINCFHSKKYVYLYFHNNIYYQLFNIIITLTDTSLAHV